jgi:hypothetical protein
MRHYNLCFSYGSMRANQLRIADFHPQLPVVIVLWQVDLGQTELLTARQQRRHPFRQVRQFPID